jgi:hypothetical protein
MRTMVGSARMLYRSSHTSRQAACCFALDAAKECKYSCTSHRITLTKDQYRGEGHQQMRCDDSERTVQCTASELDD